MVLILLMIQTLFGHKHHVHTIFLIVLVFHSFQRVKKIFVCHSQEPVEPSRIILQLK